MNRNWILWSLKQKYKRIFGKFQNNFEEFEYFINKPKEIENVEVAIEVVRVNYKPVKTFGEPTEIKSTDFSTKFILNKEGLLDIVKINYKN